MTPELAWIITVSILLMLVAMFLVLYWVQLVTLAKKIIANKARERQAATPAPRGTWFGTQMSN